ncbi:MAG: hypothetical protein ACKO38_02300, partial [Planctomycetota bacterium]
ASRLSASLFRMCRESTSHMSHAKAQSSQRRAEEPEEDGRFPTFVSFAPLREPFENVPRINVAHVSRKVTKLAMNGRVNRQLIVIA